MPAAAQVLVVEDDEMIADVIRVCLSLDGYDVTHVTNGPAGLATVLMAPPAIVILDLMLPGMDGWEVLHEIRAEPRTAHIPVIVLTAKTMPADQIRAYNLGASAYIRKPFLPEELLGKVAQLVEDGVLVSPRSLRQPERAGQLLR
jgi:CheY-like chemotaxis protein